MRKFAIVVVAAVMCTGGTAVAAASSAQGHAPNPHIVAVVPYVNGGTGGYILYSNGKLLADDGAPFYGDARSKGISSFAAVAQDGSGTGYWLVTTTGQVFTFGNLCQGDAVSESKIPPPIVGTMFLSQAQQNNGNIDTGFLMVDAQGKVGAYTCNFSF